MTEQSMHDFPAHKLARTSTLEIAYEEAGDPMGFAVILLHGFPDDVRAWDGVVPPLAASGYRVLVPYLRGYGPTRFIDPVTARSGQQAAIGQDLIDFANALGLRRFALAGYDWGGRAASIVAALYPRQVGALLLIGGYTIQNPRGPSRPASALQESAMWYQWYFSTDRGRAGLEKNRRDICRLLWRQWSPGWRFSEDEFERTARSFDNPDFVDVVIHSYRHRHGWALGEPRFKPLEEQLSTRPPIPVPTIMLHGADDGVDFPSNSERQQSLFTGAFKREVVADAGHFMPREQPKIVAGRALALFQEHCRSE